jgi:hypothetical protein
VGVVLESSDPSDALYVQLGANGNDYGEVTSGEQYFFVACHLQVGVMPALRAIPLPGYDYGGRLLTYAVEVLLPLPVPQSVSGVSVATAPNTLVLQVNKAALYTVHYQLDSGSMQLTVITDAGARTTNIGQVNGEGGVSLAMQAGPVAIRLLPAPETGVALDWTVQLGIAPEVHGFEPPDGALLQQSPARISVQSNAPGQLVIDRQAVAGSYDQATGLISYVPSRPLAAGIHIVEVQGTDGTFASQHATIRIMPSLSVQPSGTPSGTFDGQNWIDTSTPDGRYGLRLPADWEMASRDGTVLLAEPHGSALVQVSERLLDQVVDASTIARAIASRFPGGGRVISTKGGAAFTTTLTAKNGDRATLDFLVLPSLSEHSLLLAAGLSEANKPALASEVEAIFSSFKANGDAGVIAARTWSHYDVAGFSLDYPSGWIGDFTSTDTALLVGPFDGAYLVGENSQYAGPTTATAMATAGAQVVAMIRNQVHNGLQVQTSQAAAGIYRWIGTYSSDGGKTLFVELGQVIAGAGGRLQVLWGDANAELTPSEVPVLARSLDSEAQTAGRVPPLAFTVATAVRGISTAVPAAMLKGESTGQSASSVSEGGQASDPSIESFTNQMILDQTANDMTQQSVAFSDYMNSEYGDGTDIWQPTYYGA